jgi:glycerol uptake operon antiterminator
MPVASPDPPSSEIDPERARLPHTPPRPEEFLRRLAVFPCCPATTTGEQLECALDSRPEVLLILRANGLTLGPVIDRIHKHGKLVAVHLDLVSGLRSDRAAVEWLAESGADAVVTSRGHLIASIRQHSMTAIQRLLLIRHTHLTAGVASIKRSDPDAVEVLPGILLPQVRAVLPDLGLPLLAGGFVRSRDDVAALLANGAIAVTTSSEALWDVPDDRV